MKRSTIDRDAGKVRAWQDRSRLKATENARTRPRKPLARSALKPRADDTLPPVRFRARTPANAKRCAFCGKRAESHHHWLPQQQIRAYVRSLRLSEQSARAVVRKLLADDVNLVATCNACHEAHENRVRPFAGEDVPHAARVSRSSWGWSTRSAWSGCTRAGTRARRTARNEPVRLRPRRHHHRQLHAARPRG